MDWTGYNKTGKKEKEKSKKLHSLDSVRLLCGPCDGSHLFLPQQLEDVEVAVADHVQKVMKPNFAASWEEVGPENELEDTYALSSMSTLEGMLNLEPSQLF